MLEKVRRKMKSGATYVLVAGLTVIFMFFFGVPTQNCGGGGPGQGQRTNAHLATVGGTDLYSTDVSLIYNRVFSSNQSEEDQYEQRRASSLRNLMLIHLFADRAYQAGLRVSEKELADYIQSAARNVEYRYTYGRSGSFNGHYYKAYVQNRLRASLEGYEAFKRHELLARKYLAMHAAQGAVPEPEVEMNRRIKNTEMNLAFVGLSTDKLSDSVEVSEADVSTFLDEHLDRVETYYEENKDEEFSKPARLQVRRIYIGRPGESADDSEREQARKKWERAQRRVFDEGESVADVADDLDESYSENEGGMMGWSTVENMDQNIADALEGKEIGTTERVQTDRAYMIVKLEGRKEAETSPLEEVRDEIARQLIQQDRVDKLVEETSEQLKEKTAETGSLEEALADLQEQSDKQVWADLNVQETGNFTLESQGPPSQLAGQLGGQMGGLGGSWAEIPKIGTSQKLAVDAFKHLTPDNPVPDEVYEIDSTKYLVHLKSKTTPEDQDQDSTESVERQLSDQKISKLLGRWSAIFGSLQGRLIPPMKDYGPWIERQLKTALDEGTVTIHEKNSPVAQLTKQMLEPGGAAPPGQKAKGKGKTIELGGGKGKKQKGPIKLKGGDEKGGGSKSINLKKLKKKLKGAKKKGKGSPEPAEGKSGESSPSGGE